jgi:hypothetical protein
MSDCPWLQVPLDDYERHMRSAAVGQLAVLDALFREAVVRWRPESVAILGIAGGNGLDAIDPSVTRRVVGIDINRDYLAETDRRYGQALPLELHALDLTTQSPDMAPVALVHAALIFEHTGLEHCLDNAIRLLAPHGHLSVVLQLPSTSEAAVGAHAPQSLQALARDFTFIDPPTLVTALDARGCRSVDELRRFLPGGKAFWMGCFEKQV